MGDFKEEVNTKKIEVPPYSGKVKIEMFDERGERSFDHEQENYVSPYAFLEIEKLIPYAFALGQHNTASQPGTGRTLLDKVTGIALMNNDAPIDKVNDRFIPGVFVAKGEEKQTSATTTRGAFNPVESVIYDPTYKKIVIDFPTSSANGTFTDIYGLKFSSDYGRPGLEQNKSIPTTYSLNSERTNNNFSFAINGNYYTVKTFDNKIEVYKYTTLEFSSVPGAEYGSSTIGSYTLGKRSGNDFTKYNIALRTGSYITNTYVSYTFDNSYMYIYLTYYRELYRIPIDTEGTPTKVRTFTSTELPKNGSQDYSIAYNPADNLLYFLSIEKSPNSTTSPGTLIKVSKTDYAILSNDPLKISELGLYSNTISAGHFSMFHPTHKNMLMTDTNIIDVTDKRIIHTSYEGGGYSYGIIGKYLTSRGLISNQQSFFSRVKLDAPVTKTSSQTMKITYEWTMTPINLAD